MTSTSNDFERIVIQEIPLIDVRAPIEFKKGTFLNAINLPLMNDDERHLVGIQYKENGNEEAVKLGHHLVSGEKRQARVDAWTSHLNKHPNSMLYCFRGGMRSSISQEWIYAATGKEVTRLEGGYKAFRNYLISKLSPSEQNSTPILLGGNTGSGKTLLLKNLENSIDLEGIAHHRGSSFGRYVTPQPTQINFENNLAYALIQHKHQAYRYMILEDESPNIGRCFIPQPLFEYFNSGLFVLIELPVEERVNITMDEYVVESQAYYLELFGEDQGLLEWYNYISDSINRVKKRLGGDLYKRIMASFELAYKEQVLSGSNCLHKNWIEILLKEYYDPMYEYQIQKKSKIILFRGNTDEVLGYFKTFYSGRF
ncbi:MAG: tRNA 2-selenouridine synthase [Peptococcaceae bacterium BICA1-8]|nr:MAG: tRNA 2-selenouridine synthase [Peptococcaceae bacterium BICA1-8]